MSGSSAFTLFVCALRCAKIFSPICEFALIFRALIFAFFFYVPYRRVAFCLFALLGWWVSFGLVSRAKLRIVAVPAPTAPQPYSLVLVEPFTSPTGRPARYAAHFLWRPAFPRDPPGRHVYGLASGLYRTPVFSLLTPWNNHLAHP